MKRQGKENFDGRDSEVEQVAEKAPTWTGAAEDNWRLLGWGEKSVKEEFLSAGKEIEGVAEGGAE